MSISNARSQLTELVNRAFYSGERTVLQKHGKPLAAIISIKDLELLERIIEKIEDYVDIQDAEAALAEFKKDGAIPWDKVRDEIYRDILRIRF